MEKDIVPALLELIEQEFDEKTYNSNVLKKAIQSHKLVCMKMDDLKLLLDEMDELKRERL